MSFPPTSAHGRPAPHLLGTHFGLYTGCPTGPRAPGAPDRTAVLALPAELSSVRSARHFVADLVTQWGLGADIRAAAELVVSELAGNAARHGRSQMTIRLASGGDSLHVTVSDSGPPRPEREGFADGAAEEHGRGLPIVRSLARSVLFSRGPRGWRVDVVLRLPDPWRAAGGTDVDAGPGPGRSRGVPRVRTAEPGRRERPLM